MNRPPPVRPIGLPRRGMALLPLLLGACSVLPDRPYRETQRFALAPEPPAVTPAATGGPILLVRSFRAAPGLETRGLRTAANGEVSSDYYAEWSAPPADLAEEAVRRWLTASGRFAAVIAPGSRLRAGLILEGELTRLEADPAGGVARAGLSTVLLADTAETARVLATPVAEGTAPLPGGGRPTAATSATAMREALAVALGALEAAVLAALPAGAGGGAGRRR